jgi:hypothetical protein
MIFYIIIIAYIFIFFVLSRLIVPHLGFGKDQLPHDLPPDMAEKINSIKNVSKNKNEFLLLSYKLIGKKYKTGRIQTLTKFWNLYKNFKKVWISDGIMPCTQSNFILRIFLIKSGFFTEDEIKKKHSFLNFSIHQYLKIKLDGKWVDVDVGEYQRGIRIGQRVNIFG